MRELHVPDTSLIASHSVHDTNADALTAPNPSRPHITDDDRLYAIDSIDADDFGIRDYQNLSLF